MSPSNDYFSEIDLAAVEANPENDPEIARAIRICKEIVNQKE